MPKPLLLQLLHTYSSDVSGGQFQWSAELQFQSSGMVYLALVPTVDEEVDVDAPERIAINTGFDLFTVLESSWYSYAGEIITEQDWQEVVATVTKIDQVLAQELKERLREEYDPELVPPSEAEIWARRATWERPFKGRTMGYASPQNVRRARVVLDFVKQYLAQTGALPRGAHQIAPHGAKVFEVVFPAG